MMEFVIYVIRNSPCLPPISNALLKAQTSNHGANQLFDDFASPSIEVRETFHKGRSNCCTLHACTKNPCPYLLIKA